MRRTAPVAVALPDIEPDSVRPPDGAQYPQLLRGEGYVWWRSVVGATFGIALFLLMTTVVSQALISIAWSITARSVDYRAYFKAAFAFEHPSGMLAVNLGVATLIPISFVMMAIMHRVKPRWLMSVQPRIRWKYLALCLVVAFVALNGVMLVSNFVAASPTLAMQKGFWGFLVVIVLTSPLQAAAEEIFFRGYLMQALGSLLGQPWFGVVVSAVVFALFHGTQNVPLFVDRLAFGLLAGWLVWKTGGLEAGIAAHVVNNVCAYVIAGLTSTFAAIRAIREISWLSAVFDVGGFALFAVLAFGLSRLLKLRTRVAWSA